MKSVSGARSLVELDVQRPSPLSHLNLQLVFHLVTGPFADSPGVVKQHPGLWIVDQTQSMLAGLKKARKRRNQLICRTRSDHAAHIDRDKGVVDSCSGIDNQVSVERKFSPVSKRFFDNMRLTFFPQGRKH
jgi:hypothetical protein